MAAETFLRTEDVASGYVQLSGAKVSPISLLKGRLIVLEGLDGSGKETQTGLLRASLIEQGVDLRSVSFPRYDSASSALVRMYLGGQFGSKADDVNAYAASTFYAVDRYASYKSDWKAFHDAGGVSTWLDQLRAWTTCRMLSYPANKLWKVAERICAALIYGKTVIGRTPCHRSEVKAYVKALEALRFVPDIIIPACSPFEGVRAATLYAQRHPETSLRPLLFDQFADAATLCKSAFQRKVKCQACLKLEHEMLEKAYRAYNVTWENHIRENHPQYLAKSVHVEHPLFIPPQSSARNEVAENLYGAVFAGSLDATVRKADYAIKLFGKLAERPDHYISLEFWSRGSGRNAVKRASCANPSIIRDHDPVDSGEIAAILQRAALLVSIGNNNSSQKGSKLAEYMATGKPILHISSCEGDLSLDEMKRYPLGLVLQEQDDFGTNVEQLASFVKRTKGKRIPFDDIQHFFEQETPAYVTRIIVGNPPC